MIYIEYQDTRHQKLEKKPELLFIAFLAGLLFLY